MIISPLAGQPVPPAMLVDVPRLVTCYYIDVPDPSIPAQRVVFGTSGHRGSAFEQSFNEWHVLAISQAICTRMGVDPLGGASVHYWAPIAERYGLNLSVVNDEIDPTFRFMTVDWDGRLRMDPSSPSAMQSLIGLKDRFDIAFACDTGHDRHGIVTRTAGLLPPNHYLAVAIDYLDRHRPRWPRQVAVGKTIVSSQMIDRVTAKLGRGLYEVPVGFEWFVDRLLDGSLGFAGEESAGACCLRLDARVWTTDKDDIVPALLAAEITARIGRDPGEVYRALTRSGASQSSSACRPRRRGNNGHCSRSCRPASFGTASSPAKRSSACSTALRGMTLPSVAFKVITKSGWFAARPSGTEDIYKIHAESFRGDDHLGRIVEEAQTMVNDALGMKGHTRHRRAGRSPKP